VKIAMQAQQELGSIAKMNVEGAFGHTGPGDQIVDAQLRQSALMEQRHAGFD
jgi:hypothetical protein